MPRLRRVAKWTGVATCLACVAVWAASLYRGVQYDHGNYVIDIGSAWTIIVIAPDKATVPGRWIRYEVINGARLDAIMTKPMIRSSSSRSQHGFTVFVPLWLIALAAAVPTAWLWHRDRRKLPGHCRCG